MKVKEFYDLASIGDTLQIRGINPQNDSYSILFYGEVGVDQPNNRIMEYDIGKIAPFFKSATNEHPDLMGYVLFT